jgi:hypothetical protein
MRGTDRDGCDDTGVHGGLSHQRAQRRNDAFSDVLTRWRLDGRQHLLTFDQHGVSVCAPDVDPDVHGVHASLVTPGGHHAATTRQL